MNIALSVGSDYGSIENQAAVVIEVMIFSPLHLTFFFVIHRQPTLQQYMLQYFIFTFLFCG